MNRLRGLPGTLLLRSLLVVILVSILAALFLDRADRLSEQVQQTARQQTIGQLNALLGLRLLKAASEGRLDQLARFDGANPFRLLAQEGGYQPPKTYRGEIGNEGQARRPGWYFDTRRRLLRWFDGQRWLPEAWQLRLRYRDIDGDGRFDPDRDVLEGLGMKKAAG